MYGATGPFPEPLLEYVLHPASDRATKMAEIEQESGNRRISVTLKTKLLAHTRPARYELHLN
jgi:hypothetical protein